MKAESQIHISRSVYSIGSRFKQRVLPQFERAYTGGSKPSTKLSNEGYVWLTQQDPSLAIKRYEYSWDSHVINTMHAITAMRAYLQNPISRLFGPSVSVVAPLAAVVSDGQEHSEWLIARRAPGNNLSTVGQLKLDASWDQFQLDRSNPKFVTVDGHNIPYEVVEKAHLVDGARAAKKVKRAYRYSQIAGRLAILLDRKARDKTFYPWFDNHWGDMQIEFRRKRNGKYTYRYCAIDPVVTALRDTREVVSKSR